MKSYRTYSKSILLSDFEHLKTWVFCIPLIMFIEISVYLTAACRHLWPNYFTSVVYVDSYQQI